MLHPMKFVIHSCFGISCTSNVYIRLVKANGGCFSVVDVCTSVILMCYQWPSHLV